jgi:hypothetical protein
VFEGEVTVSAVVEDHKIWLEIKDTGAGIDEQDMLDIFSPFEQGLNTENGVGLGTGLGLAVTRQLIELHGENIEVSSKKERGTTVKFSLPRTKEISALNESQVTSDVVKTKALAGSYDEQGVSHNTENYNISEQPSTSERLANSSYNILLVDDEPINRKVLANTLLMRGYKVTVCSSGKEALGHLLECKATNTLSNTKNDCL